MTPPTDAEVTASLRAWIDAHGGPSGHEHRVIDADLLPGGDIASSDDDRRADEEAARVENGWLRAAGWAS